MYDVIIIGSGPAGLSAAIYAGRAKFDALIIEEKPMSGGQIVNTSEVDGEKCHSLENLLSMVLLNVCDRLLRRGLVREYRFEEQEVDGVRGKLNLAETLKSGKYLNGRTICRVDELTQDVVINRVIFSTLRRLVRIEGIDADIRARLRKTLAKFPHIEEIRVTEGLLGRLLQHRLSGF